jgi:hypothetical protein
MALAAGDLRSRTPRWPVGAGSEGQGPDGRVHYMKMSRRSLALSRETVRELSAEQAREAAGGTFGPSNPCGWWTEQAVLCQQTGNLCLA